jgi:flagellar motor protein MotB
MRARTIYEQLIERGIDSKRLVFKGYGNTEMLFPRAKNDEEESANRRVEIKIMAK